MQLVVSFFWLETELTMYFTSCSPDAFPARSSAKLARMATKRRSRKSSNLPVVPKHDLFSRIFTILARISFLAYLLVARLLGASQAGHLRAIGVPEVGEKELDELFLTWAN